MMVPKAGRGGQVVVFTATMPTIGVGALPSWVEESTLVGTDKERALFEPREETWKDIGERCASEGVGVSMFLGMGRPIDIGSIGMRPSCQAFIPSDLRGSLRRCCIVLKRRGAVLPPEV